MNSWIKRIREMSLVKMFGHLVEAPWNMFKAVGYVAASVLTFAAGCVAGVLMPILAVTLPLLVIAGYAVLGALSCAVLGALMGIADPLLGVIGITIGLMCGIMAMEPIAKAVADFMFTQTTHLFEFAGSFLNEAKASFTAVWRSLQSAFSSFLDGCRTLSHFVEGNGSLVVILLGSVTSVLSLVGLNALVIPVFMGMLAPMIIRAFASSDARGVSQKMVVGSQEEIEDMLLGNSLSATEIVVLDQGVQLANPLEASCVNVAEEGVVLCTTVVPAKDLCMVALASVVPEATVLHHDDGAVRSGMMVR